MQLKLSIFRDIHQLELPCETIVYICQCAIAVSYYELIRLRTYGQCVFACNMYPTGCHNVVCLTASNILIVHLPTIKCNATHIKTHCSY